MLSKEIEDKFVDANNRAPDYMAAAVLVLADVIASRMDATKQVPSEADVIREAKKAKENCEIKTKGDLWHYLERVAKKYVADGIQASIVRSRHMHHAGDLAKRNWRPQIQELAEAILVDFINVVGTDQGLDVGLYTKHLHEEET
jgi:hypothetical protein